MGAVGASGAPVNSVAIISRDAGTGAAAAPIAGPAPSSPLNNPQAVAIDSLGNIYIADTLNQRIEKVTPAGILSVIAGNGSRALAVAGPATSSPLKDPQGVSVDASGNVYIADTNNNRIEKVTPSGVLSIFAGTGSSAAAIPGPAVTSPVNGPMGVAADAFGNVYIADTVNHTIDKVTPNGTLSVFAGTGTSGAATAGPATSSRIIDPESVGTDPAGNVYVTDTNGNEVLKITPGGTLSILAGNGTAGAPTPGLATSSKVNQPMGVTGDAAGNVFIADTSNSDVEKVSPSGTLSILAGNNSAGAPTYGGPASASQTQYAMGIAVAADGTLFIVDYFNNTIDRIGPATPGAPGQPSLTSGDTSASLSFTAPTDQGTSAITSYQVSLNSGQSWQTITTTPGAGATLTATLNGLTDGTAYAILVRAVNGSGAGTASLSGSVTPEAMPAPGASTAPVISGTTTVGQVLTASQGSWSNSPSSFSYQWQDCDSSGANCTPISAATASTYAPTTSDTGHTIRVIVTAQNSGGSTSATSAASDVIQAAPVTPAPTTTTTTATPTTTTPSPTVGVDVTTAGLRIKGQSAVLGGTVAAHPAAVSYHFQYGSTQRYGQLTSARTLAASTGSQAVHAAIGHLIPGRVYHYRLMVTNPAGQTSSGADKALRTPRVAPARVRDHISHYRDTTAPYAYRVHEWLRLPRGLAGKVACHTHGYTVITLMLRGRQIARRRVRLGAACTVNTTFRFTALQLPGTGNIWFHMRFGGNHQLTARPALTLRTIYGRS